LTIVISLCFAQDAKAYDFVYFDNLEKKIWTNEEMLAAKPIELPMLPIEEIEKIHGHNVTKAIEDLKVGILNTRECESQATFPYSATGKLFMAGGGSCSASYIGNGLIITAGHCVINEEGNTIFSDYLKNLRVMFGFELKSKNIPDPWKVDEKHQLYEISRIVEAKNEDNLDYAILELKTTPPVEHFSPLRITLPKIEERDDVYTLGHPSCLPLKLAESGKIQKIHDIYFEADLDTFQGNSGSPVFVRNANHSVAGILIGGLEDWDLDDNDQAEAFKVVESHKTTGEIVFHLSSIETTLKKLDLVFENDSPMKVSDSSNP